jgi:hypothetical protein
MISLKYSNSNNHCAEKRKIAYSCVVVLMLTITVGLIQAVRLDRKPFNSPEFRNEAGENYDVRSVTKNTYPQSSSASVR